MTFQEALLKKAEFDEFEEQETDHGTIEMFLMIAPKNQPDYKNFLDWEFRNWPVYEDTVAQEFSQDDEYTIIRFWANHHIGRMYHHNLINDTE